MESRFDISAGELKLHLEKNHVRKDEEEEISVVILAPFTNNTKLFFEDVTVGTKSVQKVIVKNPSAQALNVSLKSLPSSDKNVTFNLESDVIPPNGSVLLEIAWTPIEVDSWRHTITIQFGRCSKKDLPITFKSVPLKKSIKKHVTVKKKSPKRAMKGNFKRNMVKNVSKPHQTVTFAIPDDKENIPLERSFCKVQHSYNTSFTINHLNTNIRRDTYTVDSIKHMVEDFKNISDDSLEMSSNLSILENKSDVSPLRNVNNFYSNSDNCLIKKTRKCTSQPACSVSETNLLNVSSETYVKGNLSTETYVKGNLSTETYVKGNLSTETYVKGNISTETYIKDNLSSDTYTRSNARCNAFVKDEPMVSPLALRCNNWTTRRSSSLIANLSGYLEDDINLSPIFNNNSNTHQKNMLGTEVRKIIEADLWGREKKVTFDDSFTKQLRHPLKRKSDAVFDISPAKRVYLSNSRSDSCSNHNLTWNKTKNVQKSCYTSTSYFDPYMSESVYHNEEWMNKQETIFKNWLNALLTPPVELDNGVDDQPINVAKLWQECKQKSVPIAPSKENISNNYHTNNRLDLLRKSALDLFKSAEIAEVLAKIALNVENEKLSIRTDKNVHLDIGLQSEVMTFLLSYNPLWLRIGLETVYNTRITLSSNSDVMGLSHFLMQNFFKDSSLLRKYKSIHSPKYVLPIKKFILKKFLSLVYFLDVAKCKTLIGHDPCLFRRHATIKESREIILGFSRELLSSVGDVTRVLRFMGYVVNHKQTYIQEFNYCVVHLGVDLRDGVRLTKVMEIILLKNGLTGCLRVPAVSRLQKIHNMKIVFEALQEANFEIVGDIGPKDIVDGHHEKTLSFLWQIIYKFQAPLMVNAAIKIQNWWRSLSIVLIRRIKTRRLKLAVFAAVKIQKWYRRHLLALKLMKIIPLLEEILRQKLLNKSAIVIQSVFKMYLQKKKYRQVKTAASLLQNRARGYLLRKVVKHKFNCVITIQAFAKMWIQRKQYLKLRASVIYLQHVYKAKLLMQKQREEFQRLKASALFIQDLYRTQKQMKVDRQQYITMKAAVITIQAHFRAFLLMKSERRQYLELRYACITIQSYFRAHQLMKKNITEYNEVKQAVLTIQRRYRANKLMKTELTYYNQLKSTVILLQTKFRANRLMRNDYANYQLLKKTIISIQRRYRANKSMEIERARYVKVKNAAISIQSYFRAYLLMKGERTNYLRIKNATVIIQRRVKAHQTMKRDLNNYNNLKRAAMLLQSKFKANRIMRIERTKFENLRKAVIVIQTRYRANRLRKMEYQNFNLLKSSAVTIQRRFKAYKSMKLERDLYQELQKATIIIQRRFRAKRLMQNELCKFKELKRATILIQTKLRAIQTMRIEFSNYQNLKKAVKLTQTLFRANRLMKIEKARYSTLKSCAITIQRQFRANRAMKIQRLFYKNLVKATVAIQRRYRAKRLMRAELSRFNKLKNASRVIQLKYRAKKKMEVDRSNYQNLKNAAIFVQRLYTANRLMKLERSKLVGLRKAAVTIQQKYRAHKLMQKDLVGYRNLKKATVFIQMKFRANVLMKIEQKRYQNLKNVVIFLQRGYKSKKLMNIEREKYKSLKKSVITVQRRLRANRLMKIQQKVYKDFVNAAVAIQLRFRAKREMQAEQRHFNSLKQSVIILQQRYRAKKLMDSERRKYEELKSATIMVQRLFRSKMLMNAEQTKYQQIRNAVIIIQQRYKAHRWMLLQRSQYQNFKAIVIMIQRRYRALRMMRIERNSFNQLKRAAIFIQHRYKARQLMKIEKEKYDTFKSKIVFIQRKFRAHQIMKVEEESYQKLKKAVLIIQRRFRAKKTMKLKYIEYCKLKMAAVTIQKRFRAQKLMNIQYSKFHQMKRAAMVIQRSWKNYVTNNEKYKQKKLQTSAAVKIQAYWRGHKARKDNLAIHQIRENVKVLNAIASENTLQNRKDRAIDILTGTPMLSQILLALEDLDFITRRCKNTLMSMSGALPEQLYLIISNTNRSPAETEIKVVAVSILINFYKYPPTSKDAWIPSQVETLIKEMGRCCDKEGKLFPYLCTLIWLFAHNNEYKKFICSLPTFTSLLNNIRSLTDRKQHMVSRMKNSVPSYFHSIKGKEKIKPLLLPDWGLDYIDKPRTFTNSIYALQSVLNILDFI